MKAIWNGRIIAQSDETIVIEGNHYFPFQSIDKKYFKPSNHHTVCPWKGVASYYNVEVGSQTNENAAWFYPETKYAAKAIEGYVAFWKGVDIVE